MLRLRAIATLGVVVALAAALSPPALTAQGVTTGAVTGVVTDESGQGVENAQIQVTNRATGYTSGGMTRVGGRYFIQGLEVGGQYAIIVRLIGYAPQTRENVRVTLGTATTVDFRIQRQATELAGVTVTAPPTDFSATKQGIGTIVSDSVIQNIPSLSRDFTELTKLTPQVAQPTTDAPSAGGAYNRLNNYTLDGTNQNDRFNLGSSEGVPGGATGGKIVSMDAVKEFQVLLSPTDVRQGNFAGMLVNAVTKSGTNVFSGGASYSFRNSKFSANEPFLRNTDLEIHQYGVQFGGPIVRDKLHFFIAPEWQDRAQPALGPYEGPGSSTQGLVSPDTIARIRSLMAARGLDVGSAGLISNENPLTNLFGRVDWQVTPSTRAVVRQLWNTAEVDEFSRNANAFNNRAGTQNSGFRLSSNSFVRKNENNSTVLQVFTNLDGGASNEFIAGYNTILDERIVPVRSPEISVAVCPAATPACTTQTQRTAVVTFGSEQFSPGNLLDQKITEIADNFSLPWGAHAFTVGGRFEHTKIFNSFAQRSFGHYLFINVDSLAAGRSANYSLGYDNGGGIPAEFRTQQYSLYAQDQWSWSRNLTITMGLRADIPRYLDKPAENSVIATAFPGVRTSAVPKTRVLWSPRIGANWNPGGDYENQVRGNIGIFTGPPPFILISNAFSNTGLGLVTLTCSVPTRFTTNVDSLPRVCGTPSPEPPPPAPGAAGTAGINATDPDFKYPQNFVTSAGFDRQLPYGVVFTFEGMYRKAINGLMVRDLNLRGPRMVGGAPYRDVNGRVLYMDTVTYSATGTETVTNANQKVITTYNGVNFTEGLIYVTNQSKDWNYTLSGQLKRRFGSSFDATLAYTFMQSKDVMSLTSDRAISNWRNGRQFAGLESDENVTTSYFERPHRILLYGTYTAPWRTTRASVYYEGMSGTPFTYVAVGDLNGDGWNQNDPIYIPRNATDPSEIRIGTGAGNAFVLDAAEAQAFERFIASQDCLNDQRGKIMERNSCRSPWQNRMDLSVRQEVPTFRGQRFSVQFDVINFLNLLNNDWGQIELPTLSQNFPQQAVLRATGRTAAPLNQSMPNFTFESLAKQNGPFFKEQTRESNFYRMQLSVKYSF